MMSLWRWAFTLLLVCVAGAEVFAPILDAQTPLSESNPNPNPNPSDPADPPEITIQHVASALSTTQSFFALWLGKYASAIDWTAAVTATHVSAALSSVSRSHAYVHFSEDAPLGPQAQAVDAAVERHFAQVAAYYFGEDHFAIRMQAFDDMLWVVLGWLEAVELVRGHSDAHYGAPSSGGHEDEDVNADAQTEPKLKWHAHQHIPSFAHRARIFYDLATRGWDWKLCGGGMTWNPRLLPYKNAITNELFISASASMYLRFPGDTNDAPFLASVNTTITTEGEETLLPHDPAHLAAAINGYTWLNASGMRNTHGLYTDGFHIRGYRSNHSLTTCDERNDMLYTYNQGVILSGLRDLWEATGNTQYLSDAYTLITAVQAATTGTGGTAGDRGLLGSHGILGEVCDATASCNQDAQAFKGIFFQHLTRFCAPLPRVARPLHRTRTGESKGEDTESNMTAAADRRLAEQHWVFCAGVEEWVRGNAWAALRSRDAHGVFGGDWGLRTEPLSSSGENEEMGEMDDTHEEEWVDYRNRPELVRALDIEPDGAASAGDGGAPRQRGGEHGGGRTVETQGSGLAVVRAAWEFARWRREGPPSSSSSSSFLSGSSEETLSP